MRAVTVRDLQRNVKACVDQAQRDRVVITRRGQPAALLVGVEGQGWEDVVLQADPGFWRLIRARRRGPTVSGGALRRRLGVRRGRTSRTS